MFYENLKKICKDKGTNVTRLITELQISPGNLTNWKNGRKPKTEIALRIAEQLGVTVEMLFGTEPKKESPTTELTGDEALMFALYGDDNKDITHEMLDDIRKFANFVREQKKINKES